ncbi:transcription factor bHLH154-like isoform X2 [Impatiens glandulifera]|uniref:transcription factor bHLH154-like isoform X2 n=1 Tax=Impatiens glandulifera TaxID=253017 RepID=UPI001FB17420|nr:transcription factor bHLH154-like isoform X2 [Impatiens glandulifera]
MIYAIPPRREKRTLGQKFQHSNNLFHPLTDTASVLHEAMEYITFLHDQVKVLSSPYLQSNPIPMNKLQEGDDELYNLRSKGLCLVPITYAAGIAGSNGADIWAPIKTTTTTSRY